MDFEQAFVVKPDGIYEVDVERYEIYTCRRGGKTVSGPRTVISTSKMRNFAGGHTHPEGKDGKVSPYPGPGDNKLAQILGLYERDTYVMSSKGVYAVAFDKAQDKYFVRTVTGKRIPTSEKKALIWRWKRGGFSSLGRCKIVEVTKDDLR